MAYTFKYRLTTAPQPRSDGSGCVDHQIQAIASPDATNWTPVPDREKTISIPADDLDTVLAMPHDTGPQRAAKNTAYKNVLTDNALTLPKAITGWATTALQELYDANDAAVTAALAADAYITTVLGQSYPLDFALEG